MIGHNQPTFDQIIEENLIRGHYLSQVNAFTRAVKDPRLSARHLQVLGAIVERMNVKTGVAFPGRARLAAEITYYVDGEPRHYTDRSIGQTIHELIECGYIKAARRAPAGGGRALAHYVTTAPSIEELQAQISEWCTKVKGQPKREFPSVAASTNADDNAGIVIKKGVERSDDNTGIDDNTVIDISSDDNTGIGADDNTGTATVTGNNLTGKKIEGGDDFERFWQAFPSGRKRGKGEVKTLFHKIIDGKHKVGFATAAELIAGAVRYAGTKPGEWVTLPTTWLNQGRWMDDDGDAPGTEQKPWWTDKAKLAAVTEDQWRGSIAKHATSKDGWDVGKLGPPPGHAECKVPQALVNQLRLTEKYDPRGFSRSAR